MWVVSPICNLTVIAKKPCDRRYPKTDDASLGAALRRRRLDLRWSQDIAGEYIGVIRNNYRCFESNTNVPHIKKRKKIIEFLGYNFWDDGTKSLKNRLQLYRIENGITASECGKLIGYSRNTVKRIETGKKTSEKSRSVTLTFLNQCLFKKI